MIGLVKIRATEQVAINTEDKEIEYFRLHSAIQVNLIALVGTKIRVDSCDSWAKK